MNMKLLAVVTPPSIYHGISTWKTFWEKEFTGEDKLLSAVNMKNCGRQNTRKQREIKSSDKYVTLYILLEFYSMDKIRNTSSESRKKIGNTRKRINYLSGFQGQSKATQIQKGMVCH